MPKKVDITGFFNKVLFKFVDTLLKKFMFCNAPKFSTHIDKKILTDGWWQYLENMDKIAKNKNHLIKTVKSCDIWLLARIWLQKLPHSSISPS